MELDQLRPQRRWQFRQTADLTSPPSPYDRREIYAECNSAVATIAYVENANEKDVPTDCTTGNCLQEIITTIRVNLDQDCDGVVDPQFPVDPRTGEPEMLCFYAEARTPTVAEQAGLPRGQIPFRRASLRRRRQDGELCAAPTAVELAAFEAAPQGNGVHADLGDGERDRQPGL